MCGRFEIGQPNFTELQQLATASTSTKMAVLPWRYVADMGTAITRYTLDPSA